MQNVLVPHPVSTLGRSMGGHGAESADSADSATWPDPHMQQDRADYQFVAMLNFYRDSGGLARAQEVVGLSRQCGGPDADTIARWVANRALIGFNWQAKTWLPLFQFNRFDMTPRPELGQVFSELTPVYDPWALAHWFAQPNAWLAQRIPADTLASNPSAVLQAARADRCNGNG